MPRWASCGLVRRAASCSGSAGARGAGPGEPGAGIADSNRGLPGRRRRLVMEALAIPPDMAGPDMGPWV